MATVWAAFLATGAVLLGLALAGLFWRGGRAPVFRRVGRFLLVLAIVTGLFPTVLERLGTARWVAMYIAFVAVLTAAMTASAIARARTRGS